MESIEEKLKLLDDAKIDLSEFRKILKSFLQLDIDQELMSNVNNTLTNIHKTIKKIHENSQEMNGIPKNILQFVNWVANEIDTMDRKSQKTKAISNMFDNYYHIEKKVKKNK